MVAFTGDLDILRGQHPTETSLFFMNNSFELVYFKELTFETNKEFCHLKNAGAHFKEFEWDSRVFFEKKKIQQNMEELFY